MEALRAINDIDNKLADFGFPQPVITAAANVRKYIQDNGLDKFDSFAGLWSHAKDLFVPGKQETTPITAGQQRNKLIGAFTRTKGQIDVAMGVAGNAQATSAQNDPITRVIVAVLQYKQPSNNTYNANPDNGISYSRRPKGVFGVEDVTNGSYWDYQAGIASQYQQGKNISVDPQIGIPISEDKQQMQALLHAIKSYTSEASRLPAIQTDAYYRSHTSELLSTFEQYLEARENVVRRNGAIAANGNFFDCASDAGQGIDEPINTLQKYMKGFYTANPSYLQEICAALHAKNGRESPYEAVYRWMGPDFVEENAVRKAFNVQ